MSRGIALKGTEVRRLRCTICIAAFVVGMLLLVTVVLASWAPLREEGTLTRRLLAYRREWVASGLGTALVVAALVVLVPARRLRVLLVALGVVGVVCTLVLPFAAPVFLRGRLAQLTTTLSDDGVCLQSNGYNCGPACVVTALHALGLSVEEGDVAVATFSNPFSGTQEEHLCDYINDVGEETNIGATLLRLPSPDALGVTPVILPVKHSFFVNHYVVYLGRENGSFIIGDPLAGRQVWSRQYLEQHWLREGIVVEGVVWGKGERWSRVRTERNER